MACIITYKNNKYSQQEFEKYFKNNFNEFVNEFLSQDIEGFKNYVQKDNMGPNFSIVDEKNINYQFKVVNLITPNLSKIEKLYTQLKNTDTFWNKIQKDYQIPKEQLQLLKESQGNSIEEKLIDFASKYSYSIEINISKDISISFQYIKEDDKYYRIDSEYGNKVEISKENYELNKESVPTQHYSNLTVPGGTNYTENAIRTPGVANVISAGGGYHDNEFNQSRGDMAGWFRSDEQMSQDRITKSHVKAAKLQGINLQEQDFLGSKTRRILEVQSFFQKVRDKENLIFNPEIRYDIDNDTAVYFKNNKYFYIDRYEEGDYEISYEEASKITKNFTVNSTENKAYKDRNKRNQFLQLLNKDNNWVTFFIKSIIQDSAKKGYEKVLFPKGETAAKIEGHETIAEEIARIDNEILKLKDKPQNLIEYKTLADGRMQLIFNGKPSYIRDSQEELQRLITIDEDARDKKILYLKSQKQQLKSQGIEKLKPIEAFYEIKVGNILEKTYGKDKIETITDEYNNEWRKLEIDKERDFSPISFSIVDETTHNKTQENSQDIIEIAKNIELTSEELSNFEKLGLINPLC